MTAGLPREGCIGRCKDGAVCDEHPDELPGHVLHVNPALVHCSGGAEPCRRPECGPEPAAFADYPAMAREFNEHPNASGQEFTRGLVPILLLEEHDEIQEALREGDRAHVARELADIVYVAFTTAWAWEIDLDTALAEIHRAAMDKVRANVRRKSDGKIIKPPGFIPPDMTEAIR